MNMNQQYREPYEFKGEKVLRYVKACLEFIAVENLLVDIYIPKRERRYTEQQLEISNGVVRILGMPLSSVHVDRKIMFLNDANTVKEFGKLVKEVYSGLSKNKQKKYAEVERVLDEKGTSKRVADYLEFVREVLKVNVSTAYGFDGGLFIIRKVYNFDSIGRKKSLLNQVLRQNKVKRASLMKDLERLDGIDKYTREEIRNLKEGN